jgi:tellurite resistance protein TerC
MIGVMTPDLTPMIEPFTQHPMWMWGMLLTLIFGLMAFDLGVLNRRDHVMGIRESLRLTLMYFIIALLFGVWVYIEMGRTAAVTYYTAYIIEQSLSLDNIFVISLIMGYFAVPREYQHRVLFWGLVGVIVLRGVVIGFGTALVHEFDWILVLFALLLIYTGIKMLKDGSEEPDLDNNIFIATLRRTLNFTSTYHGSRFFIRMPDPRTNKSVLFATPLFLALMTIELADVVFAFDSLPAVLSITNDPFIVFSSNLFAIIGLRALYFALAAMLDRFRYLKYSLSIVLMFIGAEVLYAHIPESYAHLKIFGDIDPLVSLLITVGSLSAGVVYSVFRTRSDTIEKTSISHDPK